MTADQINAIRVQHAIQHLRDALHLLKGAGAARTAARVRLALSSAYGAQRNADSRQWRAEHDQEQPR